jgi:hypothetical protein
MNVLKDLVWDLALRVRDLENRTGESGPTAESIKRQQEWSAKFHELKDETVPDYKDSAPPHDEDEEADEDPHEHGVPSRPRRKRK